MASVYSKGSADARAAKAFLHDLTCAAGLRANSQRTNGNPDISSSYASVAAALCDEVINRSFNDVDGMLRRLDHVSVKADLTKPRAPQKIWTAEEIADALVYLAECLNLYWDDLNATRTQFEIDTFKKTILGSKVEKYGRFTSALNAAVASAPVSAPVSTGTGRTTSSTRTSNPNAARAGKPNGPQSSNVRDLKGTPGDKLKADGPIVYRIIGTHATSKNIPTVFIRPLHASGSVGSTNKVFVNSGNGYTDCACWFDDLNDANTFLGKVINSGKVPSNISNLHVVKTKADPNGYFIVGTEFGDCAIAAKKLNEALGEAVELEENDCIEEENGWERLGERITNEEFDALTQSMLKY